MSLDPAATPTTGAPELGNAASSPTAHPPDVEALAIDQGLDRTTLAQLVACARARGATRQQLSGVLRQACSRLARLRNDETGDPASELPDSEVAAAVARAHEALQAGPAFSLEKADRSFGQALARCLEQDAIRPGITASVAAAQAEAAALRQDHRRAAELYAQAAGTPGLTVAAQWWFQYARAGVLEELGREYGDNEALGEAVDLYEERVLPLAPRHERPDDWSATQHRLGNALGILGQRRRGIRLLERSVAAFENALRERSPDHSPLDWAATWHDLGNALGILAQRQGDTDMLERAVSAFESALQAGTRQQTPHDWAMTQYHLGTALLTLGQLTRDTSALARSIGAYRQALQEWPPERAPFDWARTQNCLGTALRVRGEQGGDPRELEQAVTAHRSALSVWTREQRPEEWAVTQNNLGAALHRLGERANDTRYLGEALAAYGSALQELRREDGPIAWAMTTANLGDVRRILAERTGDVEMSRQAVSDFQAVAEVFHEASHPRYYQLAKEKLAVARELAAELAV
ncbi:MAG: tetratricopeptide repeat protein [Gammaproteobacteria bacterium]|jgi:tetratricopeptide (TPR) repeat protein